MGEIDARARQGRTMAFSARDTPILIVCRDKLTPVLSLVSWLESAGHESIVMIDNDSTYEPLLEYFERTPHTVVRLGANLGPYEGVWGSGLAQAISKGRSFVVTDSDVVPDATCPPDAVAYLQWVLDRFPNYCKAGLGLRIDDLPEHYRLAGMVRDWESRFWSRPVQRGLYHAPIDTTFALYRPNSAFSAKPAIRTGGPYLARHMPWYVCSDDLSEEERYYIQNCRADISHWDLSGLPEVHRETLSVYRRLRWLAHARLRTPRNRDVPRCYPAPRRAGAQ